MNYIYNDWIDYVLFVVTFLILEITFFGEIFFTSSTHDYFRLFFGDKMSYFLFFLYFLFFCAQAVISVCYIFLVREEDIHWQANISYLIDSFLFFVLQETQREVVIRHKFWSTFWFFLQFKKKLQFRTKIFLKLMSYLYIFSTLLIIVLGFIVFFCCFSLDYPFYFYFIKLFLRVFFWYLIMFYFFYCIFISIFFTNVDFRSFFSFFTWNFGFTVDFLDTYLISKSFISLRESKNKSSSLKFNPLYLSMRFLGADYYVKKNKSWSRYWFTTKTKHFWRRYYLPFLWVTTDNVIFDELVDTLYYRFKQFLKFYWYLFVEGCLFNYLFHRGGYISDRRILILSKYYDSDLPNNFLKWICFLDEIEL